MWVWGFALGNLRVLHPLEVAAQRLDQLHQLLHLHRHRAPAHGEQEGVVQLTQLGDLLVGEVGHEARVALEEPLPASCAVSLSRD